MVTFYKKRNDNTKYTNNQLESLNFFYNNWFGYILLKIVTRPFISRFIGFLLDRKLSVFLIKNFIKRNKVDMNLYNKCKYKSFNDFFTRKKKKEYLKFDSDFISPCDSKLLVYKIKDNNTFNIKNHNYLINDLVDMDVLNKYSNGYCMIFRLECYDYHRYCYIDDGFKEKNIHINGTLHTVQNQFSNKFNVYKENTREYTIMHTKNYGDVIQIEVGALLVGKIVNNDSNCSFFKGHEKGRFEYGGSTIVLLVEPNKIVIDQDILENSQKGIETKVFYGENIAKKSH